MSYEDTQGTPSPAWEFNEPRQLHRRQLLIRPDLWSTIDNNTDYTNPADANRRLFAIWQENDISLSVRAEASNSGNLVYRIRPNSLADLTKRENRFAHLPFRLSAGAPVGEYYDETFPHKQILVPSLSAKSPGLTPAINTQFSFVLQGQYGYPGESPGEDIVLSNLLAFDVQVYDPYARMWPDNPGNLASATSALVPSDPGYAAAAAAAGNLNPPPLLGLGAFVDLGYWRYANTSSVDVPLSVSTGANFPLPNFANQPEVPPVFLLNANPQNARNLYSSDDYMGYTYDTWSSSYERDSIFQLYPFRTAPFNLIVPIERRDMQTNGLDERTTGGNYVNGPDDETEHETVPPYNHPLRGLQIKIRLYEPSTRQVRQATVGMDYVTE